MTRRNPLPPLLAVLVTALLATACTSGGDNESTTPNAAPTEPPELATAWTADEGMPTPGGFVYEDPEARALRTVWESGDQLVLTSPTVIRGLDRATGEPAWTFRPGKKKQVCAISPEPNADGIAGVLLGPSDVRSDVCEQAVALDLTTGKSVWSGPIARQPSPEPPVEPGLDRLRDRSAVTVNDTTMTIHGDRFTADQCGELVRLDIDNGKPQRKLVDSKSGCDHEFAHDGKVLAVRRADQRGLSAEDPGSATFEVYDEASGKLLSSRRVDAYGTGLHGVVSADPLILDLTEDGNRLTRHIDGDGTPGGAVGKALHENDEHPAYADTGEVLVMGYGSDLTGYDLRGFDQESGTEVWALPDDEEVVGDTEASLVTMRSVDTPKRAATADPEQPRNQTWLTAHYPGTDETPEVLARFPDSAATGGLVLSPTAYTLGIAGDLVLVQDETELTAYRLPETGSADLYRKASTPEELAWTDDDVRPEDVVNACEAVRPEALSLLELDPDLPPPAGCTWYADSDHTDPGLRSRSASSHRPRRHRRVRPPPRPSRRGRGKSSSTTDS